MVQKTLDYAQRFGRQSTKVACQQVRKLLSDKELDEFEIGKKKKTTF
jgi:hypothetical protein